MIIQGNANWQEIINFLEEFSERSPSSSYIVLNINQDQGEYEMKLKVVSSVLKLDLESRHPNLWICLLILKTSFRKAIKEWHKSRVF